MNTTTSQTAYLILENGMTFEGKSFGKTGEATGEVVFATGMTGYLETLTDPSYYGQIVLQTFPLIGNYGVIPTDFESETPYLSAYIVKTPCQAPSNFRSEGSLDTFLKQKNIIGLFDIDTRALTKIIRERGVMNGKITVKKPMPEDFNELKIFKVENAVSQVSSKKILHYTGEKSIYKVALLDFGAKENMKRELLKRRCDVTVFPAHTPAERILEFCPDGILLSNGPGDPSDNWEIIANTKKLLQHKIPVFGICLGHQLLALSLGFSTRKLKYGHRGANQPVKNLRDGRVYITSQNHGYAVVTESIDKSIAEEWFVNVNDKTCEGILYKNIPAFSVQFHPEACAGPLDTGFLFDEFIKKMEVNSYAVR